MDSKLKEDIRNNVLRRMVDFEVSGSKPYRRIPGMFNGDEELHGFEDLCVYIDIALEEALDVISEILELIDGCIYGQNHFNHTRWLMFWGNNQERLLAAPPSSVQQVIKASEWRGKISRHMIYTPNKTGSTIYRLHNPGDQNTRAPGKDDLAVFFCKGHIAYCTEKLRQKFLNIKKRSLWFLFFDGLRFEFLSNSHVPDASPPSCLGSLQTTWKSIF